MRTLAIHEAFLKADVVGLRRALGDPADFPDTTLPAGLGDRCLAYAIAHSPLALVRALLECGAAGADPQARTGIDDQATPLEEAELLGRTAAARALREGAS